MNRDSAIARPCFSANHDLRSMAASLSHGYNLSITTGKYAFLPMGDLICPMQTVFETRKVRLQMLVKKHGSVADVNRALGWEVTNARLYQIHNGSIRKDRGTPYEMGDTTAREIEEKLSLEIGWMDTPPTYAELHGEEDPRATVMLLMETMPPDKWPTAARLLAALVEPATGTHGAE